MMLFRYSINGEEELNPALATNNINCFIDCFPVEYFTRPYKPFWMLVFLRLYRYCANEPAAVGVLVNDTCQGVISAVRNLTYPEYERYLVSLLQGREDIVPDNFRNFFRIGMFASLNSYDYLLEWFICVSVSKDETTIDPVITKEIMDIVRACWWDFQTARSYPR